jgi:hypothetical protein
MIALRYITPTALLALSLAACTNPAASSNPTAAGATGQVVVPGSNSSVAADQPATRNSQTGPTTTGGAGK